MKVALTGPNGFIGSHILTELQQHGHQVTALVRDDAQAGTVAARGATPVVVDLYDRPAVTKGFDGVAGAFGGSGRPYLHVSGEWIYGPNIAITEGSALNPPPMVAWKPPID